MDYQYIVSYIRDFVKKAKPLGFKSFELALEDSDSSPKDSEFRKGFSQGYRVAITNISEILKDLTG